MKTISPVINLLLLVWGLTHAMQAHSQKENPRLVIGIVVDQMRNDYIERYWSKFGEEGFKKLVKEGYRYRNMHYTYVPTYTAPGHASIYTGTTPASHGIVANDWYDRKLGKEIYCTSDTSVASVGATPGKQGQMSPRNMLAGTVGDELRNFYKNRSRVIGIALKDRGAILPAGHSANAAYWLDGESGNWISSSFYMTALPAWLQQYNAQKPVQAYLEKSWTTLLPLEAYTESLPDENPYETPFKGKDKAVFPYDLKALTAKNGKLNLIRSTPWGNSLTADLAQLIIEKEEMGADAFPDMLCVSFSSTDYIGHQFGPDAVETEDAYLRLDSEIARLVKFAEEKVGKNKVLFFLTADHGGATTPSYLMQRKMNAGYFDSASMRDSVNKWILEKFSGTNWILKWTNDQIYLNEPEIRAKGFEIARVELYLCNKLTELSGIRSAVAASDVRRFNFQNNAAAFVQKGYYAKRSGNIHLILEPSWMEYSKTGTTHGSSYSYDTHIPMLWYGSGVPAGSSTERVSIEDIAPSVSNFLGIPLPNASTGRILPFDINAK